MRIEGVHRAKGRHIVGEIPQNSSGRIGKKLPNSPDGFATRLRYDSGRGEAARPRGGAMLLHCRSEEHTSELQSRVDLVCRLLLEKKKKAYTHNRHRVWSS